MTIQPYPFQKRGIIAIDEFDGRAVLGDQMGLGKTISALWWMLRYNKKRNPLPALVICNASVKLQWQRAAADAVNLRGEILEGRDPPREGLGLSTPPLSIINYDILAKQSASSRRRKAKKGRRRKKAKLEGWLPLLMEMGFQTVILDECQTLGNRTTIRTQAVKQLCESVPYVLALSGTPIENRPAQFWPVLNIVRPDMFPSFVSFGHEFCLSPDAPILMASLKEKPLEKVEVGEKVIGWAKIDNGKGQRRLVESKVLAVLKKKSPLQEVTLSDGTKMICTPDHKWATGSSSKDVNVAYRPAKTGRLGGQGKGCATRVMKVFRGVSPFVVKIKPLRGEHEVLTLTTETGNYVAYGCGSKNCGAKRERWGWVYKGAENLEDLHELLKSTCLIRRRKSEVLKDLPKKTRRVVPLELPLRARKEYDKARDDFLDWVEETWPKTGKAKRAARAERMVKIGYLRRLASQLKLPLAMQWIEEFLESDEKLVVFGIHKKIVRPIKEQHGDSCVVVTGDTPRVKRDKAIEQFQKDPSTRLFLANIKSGGTGIDGLQRVCSNSAFVEIDWIPAVHFQAEDRLSRIGQTLPVLCTYLVAEGTVEELLCKRTQEKQDIINAALDGGKGESFDLWDSLVEDMKKERR